MKKSMFGLACAATMAFGAEAATIDKVVVRQQ